MRWFPGTRILTWVDDTWLSQEGYQAPHCRRVASPLPAFAGPLAVLARPARRTVPAPLRGGSAGRPTEPPATEHVQVQVGDAVARVRADVQHETRAAFGKAVD